jgi:hypothetical protein
VTYARWPDGVTLLVNAGPEEGWPCYDIWHTGGPGGPWLEAATEGAARSIVQAIDELHDLRAERDALRAEVESLRTDWTLRAFDATTAAFEERAAVVAWLRGAGNIGETGAFCGAVAEAIERGEHRREGEK